MPYMNLIFILTNLQRSINEATTDTPFSEMTCLSQKYILHRWRTKDGNQHFVLNKSITSRNCNFSPFCLTHPCLVLRVNKYAFYLGSYTLNMTVCRCIPGNGSLCLARTCHMTIPKENTSHLAVGTELRISSGAIYAVINVIKFFLCHWHRPSMFERFSLETPCGLLFAGNPISLALKIAPDRKPYSQMSD
jgi:hypothetical protein